MLLAASTSPHVAEDLRPCPLSAEDLRPCRVPARHTLIGVRDRLMVPGSQWQALQRIGKVPNPRQLVPGSSVQIPLLLLRQTLPTRPTLRHCALIKPNSR